MKEEEKQNSVVSASQQSEFFQKWEMDNTGCEIMW